MKILKNLPIFSSIPLKVLTKKDNHILYHISDPANAVLKYELKNSIMSFSVYAKGKNEHPIAYIFTPQKHNYLGYFFAYAFKSLRSKKDDKLEILYQDKVVRFVTMNHDSYFFIIKNPKNIMEQVHGSIDINT